MSGPGIYQGAILFPSFTEPVPPAGPWVVEESTSLDKYQPGYQNRLLPPRRPVAVGLTAYEPTGFGAEIASQYRWRAAFPDRIASRRPLRYLGGQVVEVQVNFAPEVVTSDKWGPSFPARLFPRKRASWEGLIGIEPLGGLAEVASLLKWVARYPDRLYPRRRASWEGWEAIEPLGGLAEVATLLKWRGAHADWIARRKRPVAEGLSVADRSWFIVPETITIDKWRGSYPDRYLRRPPVPRPDVPAVFREVFVVPTIDRWAASYLDRWRKRRVPVQEGAYARGLLAGPWEAVVPPAPTPTLGLGRGTGRAEQRGRGTGRADNLPRGRATGRH